LELNLTNLIEDALLPLPLETVSVYLLVDEIVLVLVIIQSLIWVNMSADRNLLAIDEPQLVSQRGGDLFVFDGCPRFQAIDGFLLLQIILVR